jgi:hypothetical protein
MTVFSKVILLMHQHVQKGVLVRLLFQLLEHGFLRLGHRTPDAMTFALELAHADTRRGKFAHVCNLTCLPVQVAGLFR